LNAQSLFALYGPGIVKTDALDESPVAGIAGIRYHHVKKRAFLGAASRQPNYDHKFCALEV
jgi:hypothetical protein